MTDKSLLRLNGKRFKAGAYDKVVLPIGSTEYHGDHLPYGTDSLVAESLARAVSEQVKGMLLLPTMPFGMSRHYAYFPIAISLSNKTLIGLLKEVFASLDKHGLKRLLIINGHDGNIAAIEVATREYRVEHPEFKIAVLEAWWVTAGRLLPKDTFDVWDGLGHAGEGETSMMRFIAPELIDMEEAKGVVPYLPEHIEMKWLFEELTPYGVTGDPTKATTMKGKKMHKALVELLVSFIDEMDTAGWEIGSIRQKRL